MQRGAALLVILMVVGVLGTFFALRAFNNNVERDLVTTAALAQAKEALLGFAVTYRDRNPGVGGSLDKPFGYLPCPDTNNDGDAEPSCGFKDVTVIGRLPWRTLGLPPLRDSAGECLWYAVSGRIKDNPNTDTLNWDTLGQFGVDEAVTGTVLAAANEHSTPWAVVFAPRAAIGAQVRAGGGGTECLGPVGPAAIARYLDGADPFYAGTIPIAGANTTLTLSGIASVRNGTNNDRALWITSQEVFDRVKGRSDFADDVDTLLSFVKNELNGYLPASLPPVATVVSNYNCPFPDNAEDQKEHYVRCNWRDNLQSAAPPTGLTVNGLPCQGALFFAGERAAGQNRRNVVDRGIISNYLEGSNATLFPATGAYTGSSRFRPALASDDLAQCVTGLTTGATQYSFAQDLAILPAPVGVGVTKNLVDKTVSIADAAGAGGGCMWFPPAIPLANKTVRAFYQYRFAFDDAFAETGLGVDRGNGFSLQMVTGQFGTPPNTCGNEADMGVLGTMDVWGHDSIIVETDVYRDAAHDDPAENHTAIMMDGFLDHAPSAPSSTMGSDCDGAEAGCKSDTRLAVPVPARDQFEELPPQTHSQRVEVHTGCNAGCTVCNAETHGGLTTNAQVNAWVDCKECADIVEDLTSSQLIGSINNRRFSAPGNWTGTNWSVAGGVLAHSAGANVVTLPNAALVVPAVAGTTYELRLTTSTTLAGTLSVTFGGVVAPVISLTPELPVGTRSVQTMRFTAVSNGTLRLTPNAAWVGNIDDVSVKIVEAMDAEMIVSTANRTFGAAGAWTGINWSVAAGWFTHSAGANVATLPNAALLAPPAIGATYQVSFTTTTASSGALTVAFGGRTAPAINLIPGVPTGAPVTHSIRLTASSAAPLTLTPNAAWVGAIDNVSIKPMAIPHMSRCVALNPVMNSVYVGFTGGFQSGARQQGINLKNFYLRSQ